MCLCVAAGTWHPAADATARQPAQCASMMVDGVCLPSQEGFIGSDTELLSCWRVQVCSVQVVQFGGSPSS